MLMARNDLDFGEEMKLVVVESPAKAQTINKYLGTDYKVLASIGHIRDLPSKNGAVSPEENFKMHWDLSKDKEKVLKEIKTINIIDKEIFINNLTMTVSNE